MDTSEIWTSIILPLIVGPIFLFGKSVYDRYSLKNETRNQNIYNDEIKKIDKKLSLFFYPLYLKLLCIYQLNYSIPNDNDTCDQISDSSGSEFEEEEQVNKFNKKRRCLGVLINDKYHKCNRIIPKNAEGICKRCKNLILDNKDTSKIVQRKLRPSEITDVHINMPVMENIGKDNDITGSGIGTVLNLEFVHADIDEETIHVLTENLNKYYSEAVEIIESNISVASPSNKFGRELVYFLKYTKIREIVKEGSLNQKYKVEQFGTKNNLNKLLSHIEYFVFNLQDQYNNLMKKGP